MGDLRIQEMYLAFVDHVQYHDGVSKTQKSSEGNLTHVDDKLRIRVEFIWSPYISSDMVQMIRYKYCYFYFLLISFTRLFALAEIGRLLKSHLPSL